MVINVVSSLIATGIVILLSFIWGYRNRISIFRDIKLFRNIKRSGIEMFFLNRKMLQEQLGTIGDELKLVKKRFSYIGCSMSSIINQDFEEAAVSRILSDKIYIELCLLDVKSATIDLYTKYFGKSKEMIIADVEQANKVVENIKGRLPYELKENITVYEHDHFIPASCFLVDIEEDGFIHYNSKTSKRVRFYDFGFILKEGELYNQMKESYGKLLKNIES